MNKLTKIGVSALCGSLAAVSAQAGEMSVAGGATATWSSNENDVTGNPIGLASNLTFTGSGELDNGTTFTVTTAHDDKNVYSASALVMTVPGLGAIAIDQGAGGTGLDRLDDKMPTAWEETTGTSLGTGIDTVSGVGGVMNVEWNIDAGMLPDGLSAQLAYSPRAGGVSASDKAGGGDAGGTGAGWDIVLEHTGLADGLSAFAGYSTTEQPNSGHTTGDKHEYAIGATYAIGSTTLGYQYSRKELENKTGAVTSYYENNAYGVSFAVNDDLSISYGVHKSDRILMNATSVETEAQSLQAAYSVGGMSIKIAETDGDNLKYQSGAANSKDATTVALTLAF